MSSDGWDKVALERVTDALHRDVAAGVYDGAVVIAARAGDVALEEAIGFADRSTERPMRLDDVFHLFSVTKTFTAVAVLRCIDRGYLAFHTPVAEVIPEFAVKGKQRVTVGHLLSHTGGSPTGIPASLRRDQSGDLAAYVAAACEDVLVSEPGAVVSYSPLTAYAVLAEVVRRAEGDIRPFRQILSEDLFRPLGMVDTALGLPGRLAGRRVPVVIRDQTKGLFDPAGLEAVNVTVGEDTEIPAGGGVSTARDTHRWAEMLRQGGRLGDARVLSPAVLRLATTNQTAEKPNRLFDYMREMRGWPEYPAFLGFGFFLRGAGAIPTPFGMTASPDTFGGLGAGSTIFWIDPDRDVTLVLLTAGLLEEGNSFARFQRISDLVLAAVD